jgi:hypothetical protein
MRGEAKVTLPQAYCNSLQCDTVLSTSIVFTWVLSRLRVLFGMGCSIYFRPNRNCENMKKNTLTSFGTTNEKVIYEENCYKPNTEIATDAKIN